MGFVLRGLKRYWVKRNFNVTEDELINEIPDLVAEFRKFLPHTIIWTNPATYTKWPLTRTEITSTESSVQTQITPSTGFPSSERTEMTSTETTFQTEMITLNDVTSS